MLLPPGGKNEEHAVLAVSLLVSIHIQLSIFTLPLSDVPESV